MPTADFSARRAAFRKLHERGCFVIPNPWDAGSARYLETLGFKALATTSAGAAFSLGLPDGGVSRDAMLANIRAIVAATRLPVNADFEAGYAKDPEGVAANVKLCVETGVAGLSIEDASGDAAHPLFDLPVALERVRAARAAIDESRSGVLLVARAECFLVGHPDPLRESLRRLEAYAAAGADVLYAPGPQKPDEIRRIVAAVAPRPVNLLMSRHAGLRVEDLAELGVRRISVGSALNRAAWAGFTRAAQQLAKGNFSGFDTLVPHADLNALFRRPD